MSYVLSYTPKYYGHSGQTSYFSHSGPWCNVMTLNREEAKSFRTKKEATEYAKRVGWQHDITKI